MRAFSAADAKNHFGELIDAARLAPVSVTKYDRPFVVVMSVEEFEKLKAFQTPDVPQHSVPDIA